MNPVMVKEFRTRRFGRTHWLLRLVCVAAVTSLLLTYAATTGTIDWGVQMIGGIMVVFQVALIVVITPSLAANLISAERESGGWNLLMMTPLSAASILTGKLASVLLTLVLVLFATLPGYIVMIWIHPPLRWQVSQVLICLGWMTLFAMLLSAAVSSLCRRAATATTISYALVGSRLYRHDVVLAWPRHHLRTCHGRGRTEDQPDGCRPDDHRDSRIHHLQPRSSQLVVDGMPVRRVCRDPPRADLAAYASLMTPALIQ